MQLVLFMYMYVSLGTGVDKQHEGQFCCLKILVRYHLVFWENSCWKLVSSETLDEESPATNTAFSSEGASTYYDT